MALVLGALTVWLARRVLEPAERLEEGRRILEDAYDRARAEALRDTLTGLGNHRAFQEEIERQWAVAARSGRSMALAILDLDDFKRINDSEWPRRRRPGAAPGGDDDGRLPAPLRSGVPHRRRRVRTHPVRTPTRTGRRS